VQLLHEQAFYKPEHDGAPSLCHNDNWYWHIDPPNEASIWIALTDVEMDNAPLYFLPGSHREELPPEEAIVDTGKMKLQHLLIDEARTRPFVMPAGHALMHHCQTIHGAYANTSNRDRLAFAIHYLQSGVVAHGSNSFDETDTYPVLHGSRDEVE
jgi:2-oxoglutarate-dependent dioxygenase